MGSGPCMDLQYHPEKKLSRVKHPSLLCHTFGEAGKELNDVGTWSSSVHLQPDPFH